MYNISTVESSTFLPPKKCFRYNGTTASNNTISNRILTAVRVLIRENLVIFV
jgi:hypothetical protein